MKNIFEGWLRRGVPDLSALSEADKYLAFLQTYIRVDSVNAHDIEGVTELAKAPELPFDQHDRELFEAQTSNQYGSRMVLDEELTSTSTKPNTAKL